MGNLGTFMREWSFDLVPTIGFVAAALAYLWGVRRVAAQNSSRPWPVRSTVSYFAGLAVLAFVIVGPVGAWDDTFFWDHMIQHIGIMMLAAPLILLGQPVLLALRASTPGVRRHFLTPILRSRVVEWLCRPVVGWCIFAGVLVGTHFTPFYNFALVHPNVHDYVEHSLYLVAALIYYYPLLPGNPGPNRIAPGIAVISLFTMMVPETMTGFFIYASNYVRYPYFLGVDRPFGPSSALQDQQLGGAIMWGASMAIDAVWVSIAVMHWLADEKRRAQRIDLETMRELGAVPKGHDA